MKGLYPLLSFALACAAAPAQQDAAKPADTTAHTVQMIPVENDVKLEVVDWGGSGPPVILLAGLRFDAHVYDTFAPKMTAMYHVYGITRRGFGASSAPAPDCQNYSATRLGEDVLAVMNALHITRPVLIGHSLAGEELSYIGAHAPEKVAGLVYLDAANSYAYYNASASHGDPIVDAELLRAEIQDLVFPASPKEMRTRTEHLLNVSIPHYQRDLQETLKQFEGMPDTIPGPPITPDLRIGVAIQRGVERFEGVKCPVLAIFADPHSFGPAGAQDPSKLAQMVAEDKARVSEQADAFQAGNPQARVVRIPNADHFIFRSNEADVLREINAFMATLH
ncbi:alpha/beta fold hydrolase [Occallatibacter riparius]|uniref:Alpha/beta hydrolase n=1 Tax=Occallatibacter riparius TaxID=1002689 RepID=A0A9J7BQB5_9BACT|nr:alpha/beta hydrolase [Occallatibacter riparius]UWZ84783.1 alpha/beta hydrolase [Occallatibacter riparius]